MTSTDPMAPLLLANSIATILAAIVALSCYVMILVAAFQSDLKQGFYCLLCTPYMLYFCLTEYDHEWKWAIIGGWICSGAIAASMQ
ncbi:MAG: hypothetical protein VB861_09840 [Planctomycetaceae bacterium]